LAGGRRLYLVAYDIAEPKRWRKVFKLMHGYGEWVQLSVFRCGLTAPRRERLERELAKRIEAAEDRVLIADLGPLPRAGGALAVLGRDLPEANDGPWIV
jgi:CRISPR-associated protein Cas2